MSTKFLKVVPLIAIAILALMIGTGSVSTAAGTVNFSILHTNDFHGQLQLSGSNPGIARVATVVNGIRASKGASNVMLVDAGDEMQGSLLSNLYHGEATIGAFNALGYNLATFGNHDFDWGQTVLKDRTNQATYPFVSANIVVNDTGNCSTAGWTVPPDTMFKVTPYVVKTLTTDTGTVKVGFIGVSTTETPIITVATATAGLCFKDPFDSIMNYYDTVKAQSDLVVVLTHIGYADGGYGYGLPVYGDQSLANKLLTAGKYVPLIIGGHSHTSLASATAVTVSGKTTYVVQASANGAQVGQADMTFDPATSAVTVSWSKTTVGTGLAEDAAVKSVVDGYANNTAYTDLINTTIGYTDVDLPRKTTTVNATWYLLADNMMSTFVDDAIYNYLNTDTPSDNDVDMFFNNAGGIRTNWCAKEDPANPGTYIWSSNTYDAADPNCHDGLYATHDPMKLTYGNMFTILPFGNATVVGTMKGSEILQVLNYLAANHGVIQPAGIKFKYYEYKDANPGPQPFAFGAFDVTVYDKTTQTYVPLDMNKTYHVGTNEFLAPAGGDGYNGFKYMQNITYWGDMLNAVNAYVTAHYGTAERAYKGPNDNGTLDGRIIRDGTDALGSGSIIPITILHNNDSHGNLPKTSYVGYTQLATLIKQERAHNPTRTLLLDGGDQIQGDAMMYYFKSAPSGFAADGTPLDAGLRTHPMMAVMNSLGYDAMTLGNHEFNFGSEIFKGVFKQANFPLLGANVADTGAYGLNQVGPGGEGVQPYITKDLGGIKVAIVGITNHRVPNYELPSNIPGLTFSNPLTVAQTEVNALRGSNDVVVGLTHIGFTENPKSVEVDANVDTNLAKVTTGLDAIVGSHSHTDPSKQTDYSGAYKFLPTIVGGPNNTPVLVTQAYRYNNYLGEVVIGMRLKGDGTYEVVSRAGQYLAVTSSTPEDPDTKAIVDTYVAQINLYNNKVVGQTTVPIDTMQAFTQETNGANLQADASMWELKQHNITPAFHLSGAMTNKLMASSATPATPVTLKISDMFSGMPYENSLVTISMNGPQLKAVLERAYRNYFYYKYYASADPKYGGYSYYTTCMIDTDSGNKITYNDTYPALPNGNNVVSLNIQGKNIDFSDVKTLYEVSTVNYLAAGSCNFNDNGVSLWPLKQIAHDTQYYVRDATIDYITAMRTVSPTIEQRLQFPNDTTVANITASVPTGRSYTASGKTYVTSASVIHLNITGPSCSLTVVERGVTTHPACVPGDNNLGSLTGTDHTVTISANVWGAASGTTSYTGTFVLDNTAPKLSVTVPVAAQVYLHPQRITPLVISSDAGSGVATVSGVVDGRTMKPGTLFDMYTLALGPHTVVFKATDKLGNQTFKAVKFNINATIDSTITAVTRFYNEKKIAPYTLRDQLIAKLRSAKAACGSDPNTVDPRMLALCKQQMYEFISMVQARSGAGIYPASASLLIKDAQWVIAHLP